MDNTEIERLKKVINDLQGIVRQQEEGKNNGVTTKYLTTGIEEGIKKYKLNVSRCRYRDVSIEEHMSRMED